MKTPRSNNLKEPPTNQNLKFVNIETVNCLMSYGLKLPSEEYHDSKNGSRRSYSRLLVEHLSSYVVNS